MSLQVDKALGRPGAHVESIYKIIYIAQMKDLEFLGSSQRDIAKFPDSEKAVAGLQLYRVQDGLAPSSWKTMGSVGVGVKEILIDAETQYRVIYTDSTQHKVYVLHGFKQKTQNTENHDIELARQRLQGVRNDKREVE